MKLEGFVDTHIHTAPDVKPRLLNDVEAAEDAREEKMQAVVLKSHAEPTSGRAQIAEKLTGFRVIGGVCLNSSVGGLNAGAVEAAAGLGGRFVWLPTVSYPAAFKVEELEEVVNAVSEHDMVLATGHLKAPDIFKVIDAALSAGVKRLLVNHPLTRVVGASFDEQKEMSRHAYLEHCYVACMSGHDRLDPEVIADAITFVGSGSCIMATDFGQQHNPRPVQGMKMFVKSMREQGLSQKDINRMCVENPSRLIL